MDSLSINEISFIVSLALGGMSVVLGLFAIRLGLRFHNEASDLLAHVRAEVRELRGVTFVSIDNQRAIIRDVARLQGGPYGPPTPQVVEDRELVEQMRALFSRAEPPQVAPPVVPSPERGNQPTPSLPTHGSAGPSETEAAPEVEGNRGLPDSIRTVLDSWREHPAHYSILWAIVAGGLSNLAELEEAAAQYGVPVPAGRGVDNLLSSEILTGTRNRFAPKDSLRTGLAEWIDRNRAPLRRLLENDQMVERLEAQEGGSFDLIRQERAVAIGAEFEF